MDLARQKQITISPILFFFTLTLMSAVNYDCNQTLGCRSYYMALTEKIHFISVFAINFYFLSSTYRSIIVSHIKLLDKIRAKIRPSFRSEGLDWAKPKPNPFSSKTLIVLKNIISFHLYIDSPHPYPLMATIETDIMIEKKVINSFLVCCVHQSSPESSLDSKSLIYSTP